MKALLLVGSPRKGKGASETLGRYLPEQLEAHGADTQELYVYPALRSETHSRLSLEAASDIVRALLAQLLHWVYTLG